MSDQYTENTQPEGERVEDFAATEHTEPAPTFGAQSGAVGSGEKLSPEKLGEAAIKFATETAYAAAGIANVIAEKARELYDAQRKQLAESTPEGVDPNFRQFVDAMPDQFKTLIDDATKAYHEMAERGRHAVTDFQAQLQAARTDRPAKPEAPEAFDLKEGAEATVDAEDAVAPEDAQDVTNAYPGESKTEHRDD